MISKWHLKYDEETQHGVLMHLGCSERWQPAEFKLILVAPQDSRPRLDHRLAQHVVKIHNLSQTATKFSLSRNTVQEQAKPVGQKSGPPKFDPVQDLCKSSRIQQLPPKMHWTSSHRQGMNRHTTELKTREQIPRRRGSTWSRDLSPTTTNTDRWRALTPFSMSVLIRSSTFFLIVDPFPRLLVPPRNPSARRCKRRPERSPGKCGARRV